MSYHPPKQILENYANVLINFALGGGTGIKKGDVVRVTAGESAKPMYAALCRSVWQSGGHVIQNYIIDDDSNEINLSKDFFEIASEEQIDFAPNKYYKGVIDEIDHDVMVLGDVDKHALEGVVPSKLMRRGLARKQYQEMRVEKENAGNYTWTLALYGTPAMASEVGMSEEEYWEQIIKACFLDEDDPIAKWHEVQSQLSEYLDKFNALPIEKMHVEGEDVDLWIKLGEKRKWAGGSGRNIPSFEIFTSPDWRGTDGWINFNQPLYRYGNLVEGIKLEFKNGKVTSATATKNEQVIKEMVATENADKVGEFSLTDGRFSRITKFMGETLFDENVGSPFGNTHIALGKSYHDCYDGDPESVNKEEWERLGFNNSSVHTDMISTTDRTVTAVLTDGTEKVIYANGQYTI